MPTILTVDDSPSVRQVVKIVLGGAGYTVIEAADGAEGLSKAKANPVNMVITDLNMPVMNGLEPVLGSKLTKRHLPQPSSIGDTGGHGRAPRFHHAPVQAGPDRAIHHRL